MKSYREVLRDKLAMRRKGERVVLRAVAEKIGVQYTFLSRALNHSDAHLNERHLFSFCEELRMLPDEIDEVFLLREFEISSHPGRKAILSKKIRTRERARDVAAEILNHDHQQLATEADFLLDPYGMVIFGYLQLPNARKNTRIIAQSLGISLKRLREVLKKLEKLGILTLGQDGEKILEVHKSRIHYPMDHPLMRTHQARLRELAGSYFERADEQERSRVMVTFTGNEALRTKVSARFDDFLKEIEILSRETKDERTYQMIFELFPWG